MKRGRGLRGEKGGAQGAGALRKLEEQKADLALRRFWGGRVYAADERETIQVGNVPLEVPAFWITGEAQEEFTSGDGGETNPGQREKLEGLENPQAATRDGRSPVSAGHAPGYGRDRKNDGSAVSVPRKRPAAKAQRPLAGSASGSELDCLGFLQSFLERQPERGVCAWREEDEEARALRHADCIMRKLGLRAVDILEGLGAKTQVYVHQSGLCQALVKWRQMGAKAQGFDPDEVKELASRFWLQQHACHLPL
ncbi:hypothetical protein TGMAS_417000 [Toxoplasma gondii MAS]|nr:hypothetical protein TGMAS_417000 [Toxoplasma gondii MAS]